MTNYLRAIDKSKVEGLYWISWEGEDMEVEIRVEPGRQEPKIVILAGAESEELSRLADSLAELALGPV